MAEQTQAQAPVSQEPPDVLSRMQNFLTQYDNDSANGSEEPGRGPVETESAQAPNPAEQPSDPVTDELTPADLPDEVQPAQSQADEFEIVHNGTQVKLTRDKAIELARQGFDYTQKTQALAAAQRSVQERLAQVGQIEQMQAALAPDFANVQALGARLQQYQNVDWVKYHADDPIAAPGQFAQFQMLKDQYQMAIGQVQQKAAAIQQQKQAVTAQIVQQQKQALVDRIPAWKDPVKYEQGAREVADYLTKKGLPQQVIDGINDAISVEIAYEAAQYRKLLDAKNGKVKQLRAAPPVTRPNAANPGQAGADRTQQLTKRLQRTGDVKDAAALLADRWK